jgi:transposase InsO family protein
MLEPTFSSGVETPDRSQRSFASAAPHSQGPATRGDPKIDLAAQDIVFPQLSRSAVYRELVRLQLHKLRLLKPQPGRPKGKFRACPPGFLHLDIFYLPRLDKKRRYLSIAIDRATRLLTPQVAERKDAQSAVRFLAHCKAFYPFRIYRILTDNGKEFTLRHLKESLGHKD